MVKRLLPFLLILILSYFSLKPLLRPGFFTIHDGVHPQRINQMERAIRDLQIPPRWSPDLGYGYGWPQFSFYSPLPYYFGGLFSLITKNALLATKIIFIIAIVFSGYFMYLFVSELFGSLSGILAGIFYIYSPYHALDLYVRGALAEAWGIMFIPLVLYFLIKGIREEKEKQEKTRGKKEKWVILGGIACACLILSHNLTALIFTIFLVVGILVYFIYNILTFYFRISPGRSRSAPRKVAWLPRGFTPPSRWSFILNTLISSLREIKLCLYLILLGLLLSSYFWLPAIFELKYTYIDTMTGGRFGYRDHFIAFRQIWDSLWDYGGSAGIFSGLSYMMGKLHLILAGLAVILTIIKWKQLKEKKFYLSLATFYLLLATFLTNARSDFLWSTFPILSFIQFPWRFLILVMFCVSFLSGITIYFIKNNKLKITSLILLIIAVIYTNYSYFKPAKYLNVDQNYFLTSKNFYEWGTTASEEYLPIWRPKRIVLPPKEILEIKNGNYEIINQKVGYYGILANSNINQEAVLNVSYFPGWQVMVNDKMKAINYQKDGLIRFTVDKGKSEVIASFQETRLRFLGNAISAATVFLLTSYLILKLPTSRKQVSS